MAIRFQEIIVELVVRIMPGTTSFQAIQVVRLTLVLAVSGLTKELSIGRK